MELKLHVGPTPYAVLLADRAIYDEQGTELEGCAVEARRLIVLSGHVDPARRDEVAQHEFFHAWLFHVPPPADEESAAQLHSLVSRQFHHDVQAAGGSDIFLHLRPTRIQLGRPAPPPAGVMRRSALPRDGFVPADRMPCATCDADVMCGSICTGEPLAHEATGRHLVQRWMRCDACGCIQLWHEFASPDGTPLGEFCAVPAPRVLRGAEAAAWMARHGGLVSHP